MVTTELRAHAAYSGTLLGEEALIANDAHDGVVSSACVTVLSVLTLARPFANDACAAVTVLEARFACVI